MTEPPAPIDRPWDNPKPSGEAAADPVWDGTQWTHSGRVWNGTAWVAPPDTRTWWQRNRTGLIVAGAVLLVFVLAIAAGALNSKSTPSASSSEGDALSAWVVCQQEMDRRLKAPATADYPSRSEFTITQSGAIYTMSSWVDSENGFGAQIRTFFDCKAIHTGGDSYRVTITTKFE